MTRDRELREAQAPSAEPADEPPAGPGGAVEAPAEGEGWDWRRRAACRDEDSGPFFPQADASPAETARAKAICSGCEAVRLCLTFALVTKQTAGVWGGLTAEERKRVRLWWS